MAPLACDDFSIAAPTTVTLPPADMTVEWSVPRRRRAIVNRDSDSDDVEGSNATAIQQVNRRSARPRKQRK
jgi:hypothetical protein